MTIAEYHARKVAELGPGWLYTLATEQHDPLCETPWIVLAYMRNVRSGGAFAIVAGYNRWTGMPIHWIVPSLTADDRYDTSLAVEVSA